MRRLGVALFVIALLAPSAARADVTLSKLRWHLDTIAGGTTPDSSGNNHPGTVSGGTAIAGRFGSAVQNGTVAAPVAGATQPIVFAWVRALGAPVSGEPGWVVSYNATGSCDGEVSYGLRVAANGNLAFVANPDGSSTADSSPDVASMQIWDGLWHAVAGVYDGSRLRLYVDGQQIGSGTVTPGIDLTNAPGDFTVGRYDTCGSSTVTQAYVGHVDEVRLYEGGMNDDEIAYVQNSVGGQMPRVLPIIPEGETVALQHHLDGTLDDSAGHNFGGTGGVGSFVAGRFGSAYNTNQSGGGYRIASGARLQPQRFTAAAWVKASGVTPVFQTIVGKGGGNCSSSSWALRTDGSGNLGFFVGLFTPSGGQTFVETGTIPLGQVFDGQWHAVAGTYEDGIAKLYMDGTLRFTATQPAATGPGGTEEVDYARFPETAASVGRYPQTTCTIGWFPGTIDEVRVYDRALTGGQIATLQDPAATTPPVLTPVPTTTPSPTPTVTATPAPDPTGDLLLQWHLDSSGDTQPDSSGHGFDGTSSGTTLLTDGRFQGAQRNATGGIGTLGGPRQSNLTVALWVRGTTPPSDKVLAQFTASECSTPVWALRTDTQGNVTFSDFVGQHLPAQQIWDGQWHMLGVTHKASGELTLWLDGVGHDSGSGSIINFPNGEGLSATTVGSGCDSTAADFDEFRIYGEALSPDKMRYLARRYHTDPPNLPIPADDPGDFGLLAQFHLDQIDPQSEGPPTTPNTLDPAAPGSDVQSGLIADGRFGSAFSPGGFSGPALSPQQVTALAWVRAASSPGPLKPVITRGGGDFCDPGAFDLRTDANGELRFSARVGAQRVSTGPIPGAQLYDGNWHAVAGTYDGTRAALWLDGVQISDTAAPDGGGPVSYTEADGGLDVGRYRQGCANAWGGAIDEVRVYDRALSPEELIYLQDSTATTPRDLPAPAPVPAELEPGLLLKWHLDSTDADPKKVYDSSGNRIDGTLSPQTSRVAPARFRGGIALTEAGGDTDGVRGSASAKLQAPNVSLVAWVRSARMTEQATQVIGYGPTSQCRSGGDYGFTANDDKLRFRIKIDASDTIRLTPPATGVWDGQWHAVVGTFDGATLRFYVDGVLAGSTPQTAPIHYGDVGGLSIGTPTGTCADGIDHFQGDVDEVRVYDRALAPAEVEYLAAGVHRKPPTLPIPSGPKNTRRPGVFGIPSPHNVLACDPGDWVPAEVSRQYLWERAPRSVKVEGDDAWAPINGANDQGYEVQDADAGSRVRCREIATANGESSEALSFNTKRVDAGVPVPKASPVILGLPAQSGKQLTCDHGEWENVGEESDFAYSWERDDGKILATTRTYTPQPSIRTGDDGEIVQELPDGDGNHDIFCRVSASNDVGATPFTRVSPSAFVIDYRPQNRVQPSITITPADEPNPLNKTASCAPGKWSDAYADHPQTGGTGYDFTYEWYRQPKEGGPSTVIAGATSKTFQITADQLGRNLLCRVTASNPLGGSRALSPAVFIPAPEPSLNSGAVILVRHRDNENDPTNLIAYTQAYRYQLAAITTQRLKEAAKRLSDNCTPSTTKEFSKFIEGVGNGSTIDITATGDLRGVCYLLKNRADRILYSDKVYYRLKVNVPTCGEGDTCAEIPLPINPVDPDTAAGLEQTYSDQLKPLTPQRFLWDLDGDGGTDLSCPGSAPVLRTKLDIGFYRPRVTIVHAADAQLPQLVSTYTNDYFPTEAKVKEGGVARIGKLRKPQPAWCRNSYLPPPDPQLAPCVSSATVGAVQLSGDMCPINVRGIKQSELDALPESLRAVIRSAAEVINKNEYFSDVNKVPETRRLRFGERGVRSAVDGAVAAAANNTAATLSGAGSKLITEQTGLEAGQVKKLKDLPDSVMIDPAKAQGFALDQIYSVSDKLNVNGIDVKPTGNLHTLIVPSDVRSAYKDGVEGVVRKMTINTPNAKALLGRLPLTAGDEALKTVISDAKTQADKTFKEGIDYGSKAMQDAFSDLAERLNQGPFKIAGSKVKVDLNLDGTALLTAVAKLPGLTTSGKSEIGITVKIKADIQGHLALQGLQIDVGEAYLFALHLKNLFLSYDTKRLEARGQLTFGFLGGAGLDIKKFAILNDGTLDALNVDYLAGAGQGFPVGPGLFLTKVGGGFEGLEPLVLNAAAALSVAPSTGEGCPTVGIDGSLRLKASPLPVDLDASAQSQLFCVPLGDVKFHAETDGNYADATLDAKIDLDVPAIVHVNGGFDGHIKTKPNNWQIGLDGSAKFKFIPLAAQVKGVLSSRGIAACGSVTVPVPWPFDDATLAAGAAVKFPNGVPPLTTIALIANFRAFTGCDLGAFKPLGRVFTTRRGGAQSFALDGKPVALSLEGAGAHPLVTLVSPSVKRYDFSDAEDGKFIDDAFFGAVLPTEDRTVVMLRKPERGMWTAETADGATEVVRIQQAPILPTPSVTGKVTGKGAERVLKYKIKPIVGQQVSLVEIADGAVTILKTVKRGGSGSVHYTVGTAHKPKRHVEAQVSQDGLPRKSIVVARYSAANPKLAKPRVRVRRAGTAAVVRWTGSKLANGYAIEVAFSDGQRKQFSRGAKARSLKVPAVGKRGGIVAKVTVQGAGGRTATGAGRLKQVVKKKTARKPKRCASHGRKARACRRHGKGGSRRS